MALIKCRECGKDISTDAKACPHCGAKPPYRPSLAFVVIAGLLIVFGIKSAFTETGTTGKVQTAEEIAAKEAADMRTKMAYVMIRKVKNSLREPESLDVIEVFSNEKADLLCMKYRARNGFGGYSVGLYVIGEFGDSDSVKAWNAMCLKEMYDVTSAKYLL
ncbi:MAG: zinc ribbon domain-containing protein [Nevskia sp.]|nr:zinc ribbon domain-containing protein [Nevskia sp.]